MFNKYILVIIDTVKNSLYECIICCNGPLLPEIRYANKAEMSISAVALENISILFHIYPIIRTSFGRCHSLTRSTVNSFNYYQRISSRKFVCSIERCERNIPGSHILTEGSLIDWFSQMNGWMHVAPEKYAWISMG